MCIRMFSFKNQRFYFPFVFLSQERLIDVTSYGRRENRREERNNSFTRTNVSYF